MDQEGLTRVVRSSRVRQDEIMQAKGQDYTRHDPDRLANFKRLAKDVNVDIHKVWAIYAGKHWDSIMAFVKTGKVESEDITGRLDDLHNYLYLFEAILSEAQEPCQRQFEDDIPAPHYDDANRPIGVRDARNVDF